MVLFDYKHNNREDFKMKKLLLSLFAVLVLAGCGSNSKKAETKTCSITQAGVPMTFKLDATGNVVEKIKMDVTIPGTAAKGVDLTKLSKDDLKTMGNAVIKQLGIEEGKGVTAEFTVKDKNIVGTVTFDLKEGDASALKKIGITGNAKNVKFDDTIKDFEKNGATCK